jgi:hypothetical protein
VGALIRNSFQILEILLFVAKTNKPDGLLKMYKKTWLARFEAVGTVLIEIQFFWNLTLCRFVNNYQVTRRHAIEVLNLCVKRKCPPALMFSFSSALFKV